MTFANRVFGLVASFALTFLPNLASAANGDSMPAEVVPVALRSQLPPGALIAHPLTKGDFGPTTNNIVLLYQQEDLRGLQGLVLIEDGGRNDVVHLPFGHMPVSTEVTAVFFANADTDKERELLILCEHISGVGRPPSNTTPFFNTYVFDWDGKEMRSLDEVSAYLDASDASGVRGQLKAMGH